MTENKRYRTESIKGLTPWFIVDEWSAKKKSDKITSFKSYDTHSKRKCDELTDLLNSYVEENEQLKYQNEMLSEELEQAKAVIDKKWSEYLKKKELINDDKE